MDNDLSLKAHVPDPLHQATGDLRDGGVGHAEPEDIGFQPGAIKEWSRQVAGPGAGREHARWER